MPNSCRIEYDKTHAKTISSTTYEELYVVKSLSSQLQYLNLLFLSFSVSFFSFFLSLQSYCLKEMKYVRVGEICWVLKMCFSLGARLLCGLRAVACCDNAEDGLPVLARSPQVLVDLRTVLRIDDNWSRRQIFECVQVWLLISICYYYSYM